MKGLFAIAAASLVIAGCDSGALNFAACANQDAGSCGPGMYCLRVGDQSKCAWLSDAGTDAAAGKSGADVAAETPVSDAAAETSGNDAPAEMTGGDAAAGTSGGDATAGTSGSDAAPETSGADGGSDATANCGLPSSFGALMFSSVDQSAAEFAVQQFVNGQPMGTSDQVDWDGQFGTTSDTNANLLGVILESVLPPFGDTLTPMPNIDLAAEGDLSTCGACAIVVVGANPQNPSGLPLPQLGPSYMPVSGTMTITQVPSSPAVAGSRITGSLSNVLFQHVVIDPTTSATTLAADGCRFTVTSASFDSPVTNSM
jgi:hypothetical protein